MGRVIVVDDGSPIPAAPRGVELVRQENAGPSAARNRGIDAVRAEWVLFLDDDDMLVPGAVDCMLRLARKLNAVAVVGARVELSPDATRREKPVPPGLADRVIPHPGEVFRTISLFGASGSLIRSDVARATRFDERLRIGEDREFLRRVAATGPLAVASCEVFIHRLHASGTNLTSASHLSRRVKDHLAVMDKFFDDHSAPHWEEQTRWLLNCMAKSCGDRAVWKQLAAAARDRGWKVPLKARLRMVTNGRSEKPSA